MQSGKRAMKRQLLPIALCCAAWWGVASALDIPAPSRSKAGVEAKERADAAAKAEAAEKARSEADARERADREAKANAASVAKAKAEADAKAKAEADARERADSEAKAKAASAAKAKAEADAREKADREAKAKTPDAARARDGLWSLVMSCGVQSKNNRGPFSYPPLELVISNGSFSVQQVVTHPGGVDTTDWRGNVAGSTVRIQANAKREKDGAKWSMSFAGNLDQGIGEAVGTMLDTQGDKIRDCKAAFKRLR